MIQPPPTAADFDLVLDALQHTGYGSGMSIAPQYEAKMALARIRAEHERLRAAYLHFYDAVGAAEKFDTGAGDSAVSCVLAAEAQFRAALGEQP